MKFHNPTLKTGLFYAFVTTICLFVAAQSRAGLTLQLDLIYNGQLNAFTCSPNLSTNSTGGDSTPITYHQVRSPNGHFIGDLPGNAFDNRDQFPDFNAFLQELTNGTWTLTLNVGSASEHTYHFTVTTTGLTTNIFGVVGIDFPANGAQNVSSLPNFAWHGPATWDSIFIDVFNAPSFSVFQANTVAATITSATLPPSLPSGTYTFGVDYSVISNSVISSSIPKDATNNPAPGWASQGKLEHGTGISFGALAVPTNSTGALTLVAHYPMEASNLLEADTSGHNYTLGDSAFSGPGPVSTTTHVTGSTAAIFNGTNWFAFPAPVLQAIARSYSISLWLNTAQTAGSDSDQGFQDIGILWADIGGVANDSIPMAITGNKLGFFTGNPDVTLHSTTNINSGPNAFTHIVVTRDQSTGQKNIYINGVFNATGTGTTNALNDSNQFLLGMNPGSGEGLVGVVDEVQVYSGVLNPSDVALLYTNPATTVPARSGNGIVAHYAFGDPNHIGEDSSGHGYDLNYNGRDGVTFTNDFNGGNPAAYFDGNSYLTYNQTPKEILNAFASSFTLSLWIETTQRLGNDNDSAWQDAGIAAADVPGGAFDIVPIGLTGGAIGFNTGAGLGVDDDNMNSTVEIDNGVYHHLVVTRNQGTGEKQIYIDGELDNNDFAVTNLLKDPVAFAFGAGIDATKTDPSQIVNGGKFNGAMADIQLYSHVLSADQIQFLFDNPGAETSNTDFNPALNTTNLNWTTSGNSLWFIETANTLDGISAAQSGSIINNQSSVLSVIVTGPGILTYHWQISPNAPNFDLEFDVDGHYTNDISGGAGWEQDGPYSIPAGQHTLSWTATANGDTDPTEAGFLDEVSYVIAQPPVITVNPFDQTNHPGYPVGLIAGASANVPVNWQWFKVGTGTIPGATNAFFTPSDSGASTVAGQYFAIASTLAGSANTTTASVSFATGTVPPDWSVAFKSPFGSQNVSNVTKDFYFGAVLDVSNNLYSAAEFSGNMTFNGTNIESGLGFNAAALVKQTATGAPLWVVTLTNNNINSFSYCQCVAPAPGGGVYFSGNYSGTQFLGATPVLDAGGGDIFLTRFDANGNKVWFKTIGGTNSDFMTINCLVADPSGNVTLSGLLGSGAVTIGASNYNIVGQEGVLVQFDSTGNIRWSQILPGEWCQHLAYDSGRIYASIPTYVDGGGATNLIIGGTTNSTDRAWGVACLNAANGQAIWTRGVGARIGSTDNNPYASSGLIDDVPRVAVSGTNVFMTGVAYDTNATFGNLTVNFAQARGQYFARYDTNGNAQLAVTYGSVTTTPISAIADTNGNLYVSGDFDNASFFGADMLAAPQNRRFNNGDFSQAFLAKFDRNGNALWARQAVAAATVSFRGIALASDGVWASGFCISTNVGNSYTLTKFGNIQVDGDSTRFVFEGPAGGGLLIIATGYPGGVLAKITESNSVSQISPITLINNGISGGNFNFSFLSTSGHTNFVEATTNLATANWSPYTNIVGDGTLKSIVVPVNNPALRFFRVRTP